MRLAAPDHGTAFPVQTHKKDAVFRAGHVGKIFEPLAVFLKGFYMKPGLQCHGYILLKPIEKQFD
jgi:hypothetical protein